MKISRHPTWRRTLPGLLGWTLASWRDGKIDIHCIDDVDEEQFHTHVAKAIRIILWGGYVEELYDGRKRTWRPGMIGLITPDYCHRVASLRNGRCSYSLWIRFKRTHTVDLRSRQ